MNRKQFTLWLLIFKLLWLFGGTAYGIDYTRLDCRNGVCYLDSDEWLDQQVESAVASKPHPAVCRIATRDRDGASSYGTGTLIETNDDGKGLVLTASHVVRDASSVVCLFANGQQQGAKVLEVDRTWDLAVLMIYAPRNVEPVEIMSTPPATGESLWIAGYGGTSERYAQQGGRLVSHSAPARNLPYEFINVEGCAARQGDSGGPIFNAQYQLAGCLWGSNKQYRRTVGCHCRPIQRLLQRIRARRGKQGHGATQQPATRPAAPPAKISQPALPGPVDDPNAPPKPIDETPPVTTVTVIDEPPASVSQPAEKLPTVETPAVPIAKQPAAPVRFDPTPVADAGGIVADLLPKLITWGLAAGGITLPTWVVWLLGRGAVRAFNRWRNKRPPSDPPAVTSTTDDPATRPISVPPPPKRYGTGCPPPPLAIDERHHNHFVEVPVSLTDRAWADAHRRYAEAYPGVANTLRAIERIKDQILAGEPCQVPVR